MGAADRLGAAVKARLITRCGCERTINISAPPPPVIVLPLRPREPNEGTVRGWMNADPGDYDPKRDGLTVRRFRLSQDSLNAHRRWDLGDSPIWYDEETDYDPPGYDADKRTYSKAATPLTAHPAHPWRDVR